MLTYLWSLKTQFAKYFTVGFSATALDILSLIFFKEIVGFSPVLAVVVNQVLVIIFVFALNKYWSFTQHADTRRQMARYGLVVLGDYLFSIAAMYVFNDRLGIDYRLVRIASIALAVSWNFFLYKYWVYEEGAQASVGQQP
jgi:putative flippase GtrA